MRCLALERCGLRNDESGASGLPNNEKVDDVVGEETICLSEQKGRGEEEGNRVRSQILV